MQLPAPLRFTTQEITLTADMVNQHFAQINYLSHQIDLLEQTATNNEILCSTYVARAIEFALVQDYSSAIDDITSGEYDTNRLEKIMAYMPKTIRSMFIAIGILKKSEDSANDLAFLSDYFFSHYQEKFDVTSTQTQRILSALSQSESGLSLSEIREITGQENGKISPYLKLMIDQKLISKEAKSLRGGIYSIADPLFKLWLRHNSVTTTKR
jgi:predicted transcriptional regulator